MKGLWSSALLLAAGFAVGRLTSTISLRVQLVDHSLSHLPPAPALPPAPLVIPSTVVGAREPGAEGEEAHVPEPPEPPGPPLLVIPAGAAAFDALAPYPAAEDLLQRRFQAPGWRPFPRWQRAQQEMRRTGVAFGVYATIVAADKRWNPAAPHRLKWPQDEGGAWVAELAALPNVHVSLDVVAADAATLASFRSVNVTATAIPNPGQRQECPGYLRHSKALGAGCTPPGWLPAHVG